jgi:23S rRNA (pseudouridine1915-N3)-methyltransferase
MQIGICAVGRMKSGPEKELVTRYLDRAEATARPLGLTGFNVTEIMESRASSTNARKTEEARQIIGALPTSGEIVTMDERGKAWDSVKFAEWISQLRADNVQSLNFVIGGADGLAPDLLTRASFKLSFSPFTWPHQLVRIMLAEQLYRTTTILTGHPYHRA